MLFWQCWRSTSGCLRQILGNEEPCLPRGDDVAVAVAIDVFDHHLKPAAGAAAVVDDVADPVDGAVLPRAELIPVDAHRLTLARVGAAAAEVALGGNQIRL